MQDMRAEPLDHSPGTQRIQHPARRTHREEPLLPRVVDQRAAQPLWPQALYLTKGRSSYQMKLGEYSKVPPNIQEDIVAKTKVAAE